LDRSSKDTLVAENGSYKITFKLRINKDQDDTRLSIDWSAPILINMEPNKLIG